MGINIEFKKYMLGGMALKRGWVICGIRIGIKNEDERHKERRSTLRTTTTKGTEIKETTAGEKRVCLYIDSCYLIDCCTHTPPWNGNPFLFFVMWMKEGEDMQEEKD